MPALELGKLARELQAAGAAPNTIARMIQELKDHCVDAEAAAIDQGLSRREARRRAGNCLGSVEEIVQEVSARRCLLDWRHRWPRSARCVDSMALCLAVPAAPFVYFTLHPAGLVRWGVSLSLAALITGSILFGLQWMFDLQWFLGAV